MSADLSHAASGGRRRGTRRQAPRACEPGADALGSYLRSIRRIPLLDAESLRGLLLELRRLRETGEREAYQELKNRVVMHNLRLVVSCALRWQQPAPPLLDRIQEGNLGLMDAVDRFDPDRRVRFSTYAVWWIRRNLLCAAERQGPLVRFPRRVRALRARAQRTEQELRAARGEAPAPEELAAGLLVSCEVIDRLRLSRQPWESFERGCGARGLPLAESLADPEASRPDAAVVSRWARRVLERGLASVDERSRRILRLRWGLDGSPPLTNVETGAYLGLSPQRVNQIERLALARLRSRRELESLIGTFG